MGCFLLQRKWDWIIRIRRLQEVKQDWEELDGNKEIYIKGGKKSQKANSTYFTFLPGFAEGKETFFFFPHRDEAIR